MFKNDRDQHYRNMLHQLQRTLASIHQGTNEFFLNELTDLEENRDEELVRLNLWEDYQRQCSDREFQIAVEQINEEHEQIIKLAKEKLYDKLEKTIKKHKEDKALIDVANDNSYFLNGGFSTRSNGNTESPGSPSLSGFYNDRRNLRKRGQGEDMSSNYEDSVVLSGDGTGSRRRRKARNLTEYRSSTGPGAVSGGNGKNNSNNNNSDDFFSDRDGLGGLLFGDKKSSSRSNNVFPGVPGLKTEEVGQDIHLMKMMISAKGRV